MAFCALARSIGFPCRMVFLWDHPNPDFSKEFPFHVYAEVDVNKGGETGDPLWMPVETTPMQDPVTRYVDVVTEFGDVPTTKYFATREPVDP